MPVRSSRHKWCNQRIICLQLYVGVWLSSMIYEISLKANAICKPSRYSQIIIMHNNSSIFNSADYQTIITFLIKRCYIKYLYVELVFSDNFINFNIDTCIQSLCKNKRSKQTIWKVKLFSYYKVLFTPRCVLINWII